MPNYFEELGYIPVEDRNHANHRTVDTGIINDTKRVFDYPYFSKFQTIKNLFSASNNSSSRHDENKKLLRDFEPS